MLITVEDLVAFLFGRKNYDHPKLEKLINELDTMNIERGDFSYFLRAVAIYCQQDIDGLGFDPDIVSDPSLELLHIGDPYFMVRKAVRLIAMEPLYQYESSPQDKARTLVQLAKDILSSEFNPDVYHSIMTHIAHNYVIGQPDISMGDTLIRYSTISRKLVDISTRFYPDSIRSNTDVMDIFDALANSKGSIEPKLVDQTENILLWLKYNNIPVTTASCLISELTVLFDHTWFKEGYDMGNLTIDSLKQLKRLKISVKDYIKSLDGFKTDMSAHYRNYGDVKLLLEDFAEYTLIASS